MEQFVLAIILLHYVNIICPTLNKHLPFCIQGQRSIILQCLLTRKTVVVPSCVRDLDLAAMAAKTEGFVARDLEYIVSRAIHANLMAKASVEGT